MDSIITLGQKNTLAEYMILSGADNRPPMVDKDLYDSWKNQMELYMQNREHKRMIIELVEHGPLIWPTVEENDVIRTKKYAKLSAAEKIQADCDMKATNVILQGLPSDIYSLVNHHRVAKNLPPEWSKFVTDVKLVKDLYTSNFDQLHAYLEQHELHENEVRIMRERNQDPLAFVTNQLSFAILVFSPEDDPIACLNKAMAFLTVVASSSSRGNTTSGQARVVKCYNCQGEGHMARQCTQPKRPRNAAWYKEKAMLAEAQEAGQILDEEQLAFLADPRIPAGQAQTIIPYNAAFQNEDLNTYDSDCDDLLTAQAVLMANISNYGSDVILEIPNSETYLNDMDNQSVHALQDFEQSPVMDFTNNKISTQQDSMILSVIEQMSEQMINHVNNWEKANKEQNNETITAELERYKERVKTFEQRLNIDLSSREKMIDSQMDDMIREKLALKEQIDSLEQNLSKQIKEKESLFKTFTVFKNESKEKENKYMENEIDLEKKIKELDNIICKVGQSAQTVHMLTKPQAFYDNTHKQALGYQNLFYLKKAQRIKPTLYDGVVMSNTHVAMPVIDDEETLILEEESRSKMSKKAKDPEVIAKKISHKPIDYEKLNRLTKDFGKCFTPQQELSAEQAFWFHILNPTIEPSYTPPVIVDVPSELPKVSLVNASLKKLKFHLTQFDTIVKKRTTPNALEEGEWGFEHTKTVFNNEIIPFLKSLKDIFNVFDKDLLNEITEVQTVFDQMEVAVQQSSVDKQCLEIAKKEILLENDRLLQKIMSQDVLLTVMNSMSLNNDSVNMEMQKCESCEKCLNLDAELSKSKQAYNDFLKNYSQLEKHCISLEVSMQLKQEVFQNDESCVNQNAVEIQEYFEINDLKARLQDKDKTICKLKDTIKSLRENTKEENVNHDKCDLEPINKELENSVAKLLSENERLCNKINHVKQGKNVENVIHTPSATTIAPGMFKLDLELLPPRSRASIAITPSAKKVIVKPMNNVKKVRFTEPFTSSSKIQQVESSNTSDSNTHVLSSTRDPEMLSQILTLGKDLRAGFDTVRLSLSQSQYFEQSCAKGRSCTRNSLA
ncbi:retrovirus-related pol polyprotein from transposon TNT 1-94 [Tanacetum coccineum]